MEETILYTGKKLEITLSDEDYCSMCGWRENQARGAGESLIRVAYSNTEEMNHVYSMNLCDAHARQWVTALTEALVMKRLVTPSPLDE